MQSLEWSGHGRTPSAWTAYHVDHASNPASAASPPLPVARPSASTSSAAIPLSNGARRSHCKTSGASGPNNRAHCSASAAARRLTHGPCAGTTSRIVRPGVQRQPIRRRMRISSVPDLPIRSIEAERTSLPRSKMSAKRGTHGFGILDRRARLLVERAPENVECLRHDGVAVERERKGAASRKT